MDGCRELADRFSRLPPPLLHGADGPADDVCWTLLALFNRLLEELAPEPEAENCCLLW